MTGRERSTFTKFDEALADPRDSFVALPAEEIEVSEALARALEEFYAGPRKAGAKAVKWLQTCALVQYRTSRTVLMVSDGRLAGFYSLASSTIELTKADRDSIDLSFPYGSVPASLVTWIAKDPRSGIDGKRLVQHAAASAVEASLVQASAALVLDPVDELTAEMWIKVYGFRRSSRPNVKRLWMPLD